MADVTVLHHPACSTSRHAIASAADAGVEVEEVRYLKQPLDRETLLSLLERLEDEPADLVRKDSFFAELGLDAADYTTPEQVADLLVEHPRLLQRPVLVRGGLDGHGPAIIGRPKDRADAFLREA